uniref:Uncharacterized protein n=1 Tax=Brassica campestris TaxID=3711 RepID=A0A3P5ZK89_BRACM|nr:unnamed protein product [Brassica rapa]
MISYLGLSHRRRMGTIFTTRTIKQSIPWRLKRISSVCTGTNAVAVQAHRLLSSSLHLLLVEKSTSTVCVRRVLNLT